MGLLQRLRDRFGPMVGIEESQETRSLKKAEQAIQAYQAAIDGAQGAIKNAANGTVSAIEKSGQHIISKGESTKDYVLPFLSNDPKRHQQESHLKPGDLLSKHEDSGSAKKECQQRLTHAANQVSIHQEAHALATNALEGHGATDDAVVTRSVNTPYKEAANEMKQEVKQVLSDTRASINNQNLSALMVAAHQAAQDHPSLADTFESARKSNIDVGNSMADIEERLENSVSQLETKHEDMSEALFNAHTWKYEAREQIKAWENEAIHIKQLAMSEFGQPVESAGKQQELSDVELKQRSSVKLEA